MPSLLLIEDEAKEAKAACEVAQALGFTAVDRKASSSEAKKSLVDGLASGTLPSVILLDIDLGGESGFELMRFWHCTPELRKTPLIVWTVLEGNYPEICRLFGVNQVVSKLRGDAALREALLSVISDSPELPAQN